MNLKKADVRFRAYKKYIYLVKTKIKLTSPSEMILPNLVTNLHALVSINTLVTILVFISVSTKDVDTKYSIYYLHIWPQIYYRFSPSQRTDAFQKSPKGSLPVGFSE